MAITCDWRGDFDNTAVNALHGEAFNHRVLEDDDWKGQVHRHSLGWVRARHGDELVGFVNVAWNGAIHTFILDTMVEFPRFRGHLSAGSSGLAGGMLGHVQKAVSQAVCAGNATRPAAAAAAGGLASRDKTSGR